MNDLQGYSSGSDQSEPEAKVSEWGEAQDPPRIRVGDGVHNPVDEAEQAERVYAYGIITKIKKDDDRRVLFAFIESGGDQHYVSWYEYNRITYSDEFRALNDIQVPKFLCQSVSSRVTMQEGCKPRQSWGFTPRRGVTRSTGLSSRQRYVVHLQRD